MCCSKEKKMAHLYACVEEREKEVASLRARNNDLQVSEFWHFQEGKLVLNPSPKSKRIFCAKNVQDL